MHQIHLSGIQIKKETCIVGALRDIHRYCHTTTKMASPTKVTVVERCLVSPPPRSVAPVSLPLTFFDIPWLLFSPSQPLFFFNFPTSASHFKHTILPNLKHTLSLTLRHFFPLAGNLVMPSAISAEPHLEYTENDSILLTIAEAPAADGVDFKNLAGNHRKPGREFLSLVPALMAAEASRQPLLAIQITVFPETGICMGFTLRNVVADWRTFNNFLGAWASLSRNGGILEDDVAFHDRSVIVDPAQLELTFLKEWWNLRNTVKEVKEGSNYDDMVRATFVMGPKEMDQIKKWILTRSEVLFGSTQLLLSPYVLVCAFIWVCWMKAHWSKKEDHCDQSVHYFGFVAGGLTRLRYNVPSNYIGNCVGFGRSSATRRELIGENGVAWAACTIGDTIKKLNGDMMSGARKWISEWKVIRESNLHVMVTGSPKLGLYELDFGWGKLVKFEEVSTNTTSAISLSDSRDLIGGIEIGLNLPMSKMNAFTTLFNKGLYQCLFVK